MSEAMAKANADCATARAEVDIKATAIARLQRAVSEAANREERHRALGALHSLHAVYRAAKEHLRICNEHRTEIDRALRQASACAVLLRLHDAGVDIGSDGRALVGVP